MALEKTEVGGKKKKKSIFLYSFDVFKNYAPQEQRVT